MNWLMFGTCTKGNYTILAADMWIISQVVRYNNSNKHIIQSHTNRCTGQVKDDVYALIIEMDTAFSRVLMLMMRLSSICEDVVLAKNL